MYLRKNILLAVKQYHFVVNMAQIHAILFLLHAQAYDSYSRNTLKDKMHTFMT